MIKRAFIVVLALFITSTYSQSMLDYLGKSEQYLRKHRGVPEQQKQTPDGELILGYSSLVKKALTHTDYWINNSNKIQFITARTLMPNRKTALASIGVLGSLYEQKGFVLFEKDLSGKYKYRKGNKYIGFQIHRKSGNYILEHIIYYN